MSRNSLSMALGIVVAASAPSYAADHPVVGTKLVVVDKLASTGQAKAVFAAKDAAITKGSGTDPTAIDATLDVAAGSAYGAFVMPQGAGWVVNSPAVAKYVNAPAPSGGAVKLGIVKPAKLIRVVARSLGDTALDVSEPPGGPVYVALGVTNGGDVHRHCTRFDGCLHRPVAGGTGRKLVCRGGSAGDPSCLAVPTTTTTTSTSTTTTTLAVAYSVDCCQGSGQCVQGLGFSLNFYLLSYCSSSLPGSFGVPGGVCSPSGTCEVQSIDPSVLCCQLSGSCYDSGAPVTSTSAVWSFRNYCVGGSGGTAYFDAVCGPAGACVAQ